MAFTVVYDACVLYPALLRDVLLRIAEAGIVRARCTREILDECIRAIAENRPDLAPEKLERTAAQWQVRSRTSWSRTTSHSFPV